MQIEPQSLLTRQRPDLWRRALVLATGVTGVQYVPKLPLADGTIYACGSSNWYHPIEIEKRQKQEEEDRQRKEKDWLEYAEIQKKKSLRELFEELKDPKYWKGRPEDVGKSDGRPDVRIRKQKIVEDEIFRRSEIPPLPRIPTEPLAEIPSDPQKRPASQRDGNKRNLSPVVVPDGAMEWLLHEVGHWLAATPMERRLPNYGAHTELWGLGAEREWQAWGFQEIVLAPWGKSRRFAPPTQRDGAAFDLGCASGPMPVAWTEAAELQIRKERVDVEQWRALYGEWVSWGHGLGDRAPWNSIH